MPKTGCETDNAGRSGNWINISTTVTSKKTLLEQRVFRKITFLSFDDNKVLKIVNWIC